MRFREQRGGLADSMKTQVELEDKAHLISHCQKILTASGFSVPDEDITIKLYYSDPDPRIGWDKTYIVTAKDFGPIGYVDTQP
jgi:hypothetical protein